MSGLDIFISYARKDLSRVEPIARALEALGYGVWWDADLRAGRRFDEEIERALAAARCVLVVWTAISVQRQWVRAEAAEALDANKLVPVFLEPVKPPLYFRHVHGVDLGGWDGRPEHGGFQRLRRDIAELAGPGGGGRGPAAGGFGVAQVRHALDPKARAPEAAPAKAAPEPLSVFHDRLKDGSQGPELVWLPPGRFLMGSPDGDETANPAERPRHEVRIARPFAIGRFPVTFADYDRFCAVAGRNKPGDQGWGRDRYPVINCSWEDAIAYCLWLSGQTGRTYRLPSEAEWEYACRAGTATRWSCGDDEKALADHAWFDGNSGGRIHPVGEKAANPWGLHDMHGNVWEWVQDHWHDNYQGAPDDGSAWETPAGLGRVARGGGWFLDAGDCRSARRGRGGPADRNGGLGFRLARGPEQAGQPG